MKVVLIDNYDSFTYNLVQYFGDLGVTCDVRRNDALTVDEALKIEAAGIVISPGPSDPAHAGICLDLIRAAGEKDIPLLGVCLGHQAIGEAFGGKVIRGPVPMHGKVSQINHEGQGVFAGLPTPYPVTRYHSLVVERATLPACLEVTAQSDDSMIMGLQHKTKPIHGVQFHPESIATGHGHALLKNFVSILN